MLRWNRESIAEEIRRRHSAGLDLSYSGMAREHLPLLRAAVRHLGSWREAVEFAGLNYDDVRRYKSWTNERIIERIRDLFAKGQDLSWRHVSLKLDPGLAAAATKKSHFGTWREAIEAAGLDYDDIRRYRDWSEAEIIGRLRDRFAQGMPLNAKTLERDDIALITAARRRYPSWDRALAAAGIDYREIVLRAPVATKRLRKSSASTGEQSAGVS